MPAHHGRPPHSPCSGPQVGAETRDLVPGPYGDLGRNTSCFGLPRITVFGVRTLHVSEFIDLLPGRKLRER